MLRECGDGHSLDGVPSVVFDALSRELDFDAVLSRPLGCGLGYASDGYAGQPSLVLVLLSSRRPSAITWGVPQAIVDTIKLQPLNETGIHIGDEIRHVMPSVADRDALAAIAFPIRPVRIGAACHHVFPAVVQPMISEAVCGKHQYLRAGLTPWMVVH